MIRVEFPTFRVNAYGWTVSELLSNVATRVLNTMNAIRQNKQGTVRHLVTSELSQ
jgi:hypothetical protein